MPINIKLSQFINTSQYNLNYIFLWKKFRLHYLEIGSGTS